MNIVSKRPPKPTFPAVSGPLDYRIFRDQLVEIDRQLIESGIEDQFLEKKRAVSPADVPQTNTDLIIAFRCVILLTLLNESYRRLAFRLADSPLCQWFIGVDVLRGDTTPSKSSLERFEKYWSKDDLTALIHAQNEYVSQPQNAKELLHTEDPLDFTHFYADSTCIEANIHYPVDWLLLRDAVRTIIFGIQLMRKQGIIHRMPSPQKFLSDMNSLSMAMTAASRNRNGKKEQKKHFRSMKQMVKTVVKHGKRYTELLKNEWHLTKWSETEAKNVIARIDAVIVQVPAILKIAHSRIITGVPAKNEDKILSLYEKDVHVIKRGKTAAELEFGNGFYLAEQKNGIITDWDFFKGKPDSDAKILLKSVGRINERFTVASISTDRGFSSAKNSSELEKREIFDATCPRDPHILQERLQEPKFCAEQKRRAQTEARIGIFKGSFLKAKLHRKGFENRERKVLWGIFTHNIWVLSRMAIENEKEDEKRKAA